MAQLAGSTINCTCFPGCNQSHMHCPTQCHTCRVLYMYVLSAELTFDDLIPTVNCNHKAGSNKNNKPKSLPPISGVPDHRVRSTSNSLSLY